MENCGLGSAALGCTGRLPPAPSPALGRWANSLLISYEGIGERETEKIDGFGHAMVTTRLVNKWYASSIGNLKRNLRRRKKPGNFTQIKKKKKLKI